MKSRVKRHAVVQPPNASYRLIPLTQNQNAIVDVEDFEYISRWNWHAIWSAMTHSYYAVRNIRTDYGRKLLGMHRVVLTCSDGEECDHENHDTLDNRRHNLRKCTRLDNMKNRSMYKSNRSGFRGVHWHEATHKWAAAISVNRKTKHLGIFTSPEIAARAYDAASKILHGKFGTLNFPD